MAKKGKTTSKYKKQQGTAIGGAKRSKVVSAKGHTPNMYELYKEGAFGEAKRNRGLNKGGGLKRRSTPLQPRQSFIQRAPDIPSNMPFRNMDIERLRD